MPLLVVLGVLTALAPLSMDIYTPSLPLIQKELGGADWLLQASITACLLGIGVGQLGFGPLSDRIGRRPVILVGIIGWTVASVASALVDAPWQLILARLAAGVFGSAGIVVARSVVRDVSDGPAHLGQRIAILATLNSIAPVIAPAIGAGIAQVWGWRADFVFLAVLGTVTTVSVLVLVPETLPPAARSESVPVVRSLRLALGDRELRSVAITLGVLAFGFYAYVTTTSFVVEKQFGYGPGIFALVFGTNAVTIVAFNLVFRRLVKTRHPSLLLGFGLCAALAGSVALVTIAALGGPPALLWGSSTLFAAGIGFIFPGTNSWGQLTAPASGASSALTGSAQFLGGVLGSPATGFFGATALTLGLIMTASSALALLAWRFARAASPSRSS